MPRDSEPEALAQPATQAAPLALAACVAVPYYTGRIRASAGESGFSDSESEPASHDAIMMDRDSDSGWL